MTSSTLTCAYRHNMVDVFPRGSYKERSFTALCFEGSTYKPVCPWQLSPVGITLLPCKWHNATLADGHQRRHARELVRAWSLSIRALIPIQVWMPINLHPGWRGYVIATSAQLGITFDIVKILLILLKNKTSFVCLFSWQIRATISKGTWVRENVLQPSTLPVFPWGREGTYTSMTASRVNFLI